MRILEKTIAIILVFSLVVGLCACGSKNDRPAEKPQYVPVQTDAATNLETTETSEKEDKFPEISEKYTDAYIQETVETIGASKGLFYNKYTKSYCEKNAEGSYTLYCEGTEPYSFSVKNLIVCFVMSGFGYKNAIVIYEKDGVIKADLLNWLDEYGRWSNDLMPPGADIGFLTGTTALYYRDTIGDLDVKEYNDIKDVNIGDDGVIYIQTENKIFDMGGAKELGCTLKPGEDKLYLSCENEDTIEATTMLGKDFYLYYENNDKHTLYYETGLEPLKMAMPGNTTTDDIQDFTYNGDTDTGHMLMKNGYVYVAFNVEQGGTWVLDTEVTTLSLEKDIVDIKTARRHQIVLQDYDSYLHLRVADGTEYYVQYQQQ